MKNLKLLRENKGMTQIECAIALDIPKTTYWSYESGRTQPNFEMLIKIADFFEASLDYLCERPNSNLIFTESLTESQRKLVSIIKMLTPEQSLIALGYFSEMLNLAYSEVRPTKPF